MNQIELDNGKTPAKRLRPVFSIAAVMILTVVVAIIVRWPGWSLRYLTPIWALAIICAVHRSTTNWSVYLATFASVYVPALQGFFSSGSHCRAMWPELFPVAPGIIPTMFAARYLGFGRPLEHSAIVFAAILIVG